MSAFALMNVNYQASQRNVAQNISLSKSPENSHNFFKEIEMTSHKLTQMILSLAALVVLAMSALAQATSPIGPGIRLTEGADSPVSDQKAGSILMYNVYASNSANTTAENTKINITNTHPTRGVNVHLFFVANDCSVRDSFLYLTQSQTATFSAADYDPDTMGYLWAVAVNGAGEPISWNYLIGDEYVKFATGHSANLGAEAIAHTAQDGTIAARAGDNSSGAIHFNGNDYNRLPRLLAVDNIPSRADGNDTLLIVNGIHSGASLVSGMTGAGSVFALLYDDAENAYSTSFSVNCQRKTSMSDSFPLTAPRFSTIIPSGRSGWLKFYTTDRLASIIGSVINRGSANSYSSGHNLHKLTYCDAITVEIPIFPL
jgi:hypothetical protein